VGILCSIDSFSCWPVLRAVPDFTAITTAKIFFQDIVTAYGVPKLIITDKAQSFTGQFFKHLNRFLHIEHRTSGALAPRTNGLAENLDKKLSDLTKNFVSDDMELEKALPLIEMSLRATAHTRLRLSPFEILLGRQMHLGHPAKITQIPSYTGEQHEYYNWLTHRLKDIHQGIMHNRVETRQQDKADYDERNKVVPLKWAVGDMVLLQDKRIEPHSNQVLCHRPYQGPFYITEVVSGDATIGPAYRLIDVETGRTYTND